MLTLEKAKKNLRIDEDDEYYDDLIEEMIEASKADIEASTGVPSNFADNIEKESDIKVVDSLYTMCQRLSVNDTFNEENTFNKALNSYHIKLELTYRRVKS